MLNEVLKDKPAGHQIWTIGWETGPIYTPNDSPIKPRVSHYGIDNLVMTKAGLFYLIEGTGRLYQYEEGAAGNHGEFIRRDSSDGYGYNFGAVTFPWQDTIFSFGGYGYWNYNWNLRYYSDVSKAWNLQPINRKIYIAKALKGIHLDNNRGILFYQSPDSIVFEGLKQEPAPVHNSIFQYAFDLNTKQWEILGTLTSEMQVIQKKGFTIGVSKFGEIVMSDSKNNYAVYFIDPKENRILELQDKRLSTEIYAAYRPPRITDSHTRATTYFRDSTFTILLSPRKRFDFTIKREDLTIVPAKVYEPAIEPDQSLFTSTYSALALMEAFALLAVGLFLIRNRIKNRTTEPESASELFDGVESKILKALSERPETGMNTDDLDTILGTSAKTVDLRNKRRSIVIKSINRKFAELTKTEDPLMQPIRMEDDRRM
ncbi:MAG: hypothetical protein ACKO3B_10650, partial [Bacteroidota bacterium]